VFAAGVAAGFAAGRYEELGPADSSTATFDLVAAVRSIIQVGGRPIAAGSIDPSILGVDREWRPSGMLSMPLAKRPSRVQSSAGGMVCLIPGAETGWLFCCLPSCSRSVMA
jgi:hypothetical protein